MFVILGEHKELEPHADLRLVGQDVHPLDLDTKTTGQAIYGLDAKVDGMVYGVPMLPPTRYGSKVNSVDDSAAKEVKYTSATTAQGKLQNPTVSHTIKRCPITGSLFMCAMFENVVDDFERGSLLDSYFCEDNEPPRKKRKNNSRSQKNATKVP